MVKTMQDFINKKVLVGICGGIAAYKTAHLIRELTRLGAKVRVIMTKSSQEFITPLTMQALSGNDVRTELFDSQAERAMGHIELARWADYLVIAPTTANFIAKMAHGIADDLLSTLYLVTNTPVIICPAMNHSMWEHQATQENIAKLQERGVIVVAPDSGDQACGENGPGRLSDINEIINALRLTNVRNLLCDKKVLITAGPTREAIDPVRYISNNSSGKMGYAMAQACAMAGASVTLISGPTNLQPPKRVNFHQVNTAQQMIDAVIAHLEKNIIFIGTAAVADYTIKNSSNQKIKKAAQEDLTLNLIKNPDILATVAASKMPSLTIGFAAETQNLIKHAKEKLAAKHINMIIANLVGDGLGFDAEENQVTIITPNDEITLPTNHKTRIAGELVAIIASHLA